ncbi:alpha-1,2-fucosyltransferase [Methylobacterium sp. 17Sr1-1]|uniref:alpha-1,2-fucosyltransferase n=1 Tax=Methylobacterium sp. 17Sr1-1 TaxID=2202826 RepID=UPI000D6F8813|nr:alpha-1,2-fucosyltransferase [Methylobacterium sp. 17Sr1-1]AWN52727.1 hypothetical protein DK412_14750 [Methylobacterium sp. 17Sr1-1]
MIVTRIIGGLGNQMFQYAIARNLSIHNKSSIVLDTSWFDRGRPNTDTQRSFSLSAFQIKGRVLSSALGGVPVSVEPGKKCRFHVGDAAKRQPFQGFELLYTPQLGYPVDRDAMNVRESAYLSGYWQRQEYFNTIADVIRSDFTLSYPVPESRKKYYNGILQKSLLYPLVSLHVRRGDYISNPNAASHHGTMSQDWYNLAIEEMNKLVPGACFIIFSDDIDWCRKNMIFPSNSIFVEQLDGGLEKRDAEEIILMSKCAHHIIANSSFSWWGAWLNANPKKYVIAPRNWTLTHADRGSPVPAEWITI